MEMKSVTRSLRILEAVAQHQPVTVGELTKIFGLPKSTVQRTLVTLDEAGWLRANRRDTTRWEIGARVLAVRPAALQGSSLFAAAREPMIRLRDALNETSPPVGAGRPAMHGRRRPRRLRPPRTHLPHHRRHLTPARHRRRARRPRPSAEVRDRRVRQRARWRATARRPSPTRRNCARSSVASGTVVTPSTTTSTGRTCVPSPHPCSTVTARPWPPWPHPCPTPASSPPARPSWDGWSPTRRRRSPPATPG